MNACPTNKIFVNLCSHFMQSKRFDLKNQECSFSHIEFRFTYIHEARHWLLNWVKPMTVKHFQVFLGNSAEEHSTIEWCSHVSTLSCQHVFIIFLILINNKSMMWEMTRIRHWLLNWVKPMTVKHFQVFLGNSAEEHSTIEWCSHVSTLSCQHVFIIFLILINNKSMMWEMTRIRCQGVS